MRQKVLEKHVLNERRKTMATIDPSGKKEASPLLVRGQG
jgi:hypothetical protein